VGFFVRSFSLEKINEILEVRKMYEIYCLEEYFPHFVILSIKIKKTTKNNYSKEYKVDKKL